MRQHFFAHDPEPMPDLPPDGEPEAIVQAIAAAAWQARLAGEQCESILVSCTTDEAGAFLDLLGRTIKTPVRLLGRDVTADIPIGYKHPAEMGSDRLANAVAAVARHGTPVVVIDCGTCITSEVIDSEGTLIGGNIGAGFPLISLGLMNLSERLNQALNTVLHEEPTDLIGRSAAEAVNYGMLLQLAGTADRFVSEACMLMELAEVPVVVTGGDGEVCAQFMVEDSVHDALLTLEGLRLIDGTA